MAASRAGESELHALLIGVDRYSQDGRPALGLYPDLHGATNDAERMCRFLLERGAEEKRVRKLTASRDHQEEVGESPTYENVVTAFQQLRHDARRGDRVLIYFSGHGGRVPTLCPEAKGADGIDEALVPVDVADPGTRYLRDVELAELLRGLTDDGLVVTLVLDCCHAGGASRRPQVRGTCQVDRSQRPGESLVAPRDELARTWRTITGRRRRSLTVASGWLPDPRGYVLLAACQAYELAVESPCDALGHGGVFTWWLLDAARRLGDDATCRELHRSVHDELRRELEGAQTPQAEGDVDRVFFGLEKRGAPVDGRTRLFPDSSRRPERGAASSELAGQLRVTLHRLPADFDPERTGRLSLLAGCGQPLLSTSCVAVGEWLCLVLANTSLQPLHVAVFDHDPDGGVTRVFPAAGVGETELLAPGARQPLPLRAQLSEGRWRGTDVIRTVAATDASFFLPPQPPGGDEIVCDWTEVRREVHLVRE